MEKKTRRNFMKTLGASVGAAGVLGGGSLLSSCNRIEEVSGDKITLLTSSGELVVVDRSQLKPATFMTRASGRFTRPYPDEKSILVAYQISMKTQLIALLVLFSLFACNSTSSNQTVDAENIIFQEKDKEILKQVFELYATEDEASTSALMVKVGSFFQETPYVAHTLETGEEQLVINLRELDCTTFAENCLAISRTIKSGTHTFEQFCSELQLIRYRDGLIDGYPSRLHYFCDWIYNNAQKNLIGDMSEAIAQTPFPKPINFMSTHPDSYRQLKESSTLVDLIAAQEKEISARLMFYIPETKVAELESKLRDGDIAGITTGIDGIAIQHVVILIRQEGRIHLMHASSKAEKVVISDNTLEEYLLNNKSASGIMLARPL